MGKNVLIGFLKNHRVSILLFLAVFAAAFLRFWRISTLPYPPDGDEVAFGYYGFSLLHFGTDEYGTRFPLNFPSIGDFKYPGLSYLNTLPAAIFGLSDLTTRFWSAASGVILVILVYRLGFFVFSRKSAALAAAWIVAVSPWGITISRLGYENNVALAATAAAVLLFFTTIKKPFPERKKMLVFSLLLFILATFTYAAERIFIPLIFIALFLISLLKNSFLGKEKRTIFIMFAIVSIVSLVSFLPVGNRGRFAEDIWSGISAEERDHLAQVYIQAGTSTIKVPPRVTWFFHNKYQIAVFDFLQRYLDHFSPSFLFFRGEVGPEEIPDMGTLAMIEIILLPVGLLTFLKAGRGGTSYFVLAWLLAAPIASSLTSGGAHINRASLMIVPLALISGYGFCRLMGTLHGGVRRFLTILLLVAFVLSSAYTLNQIFIQKPLDRPWILQTVNKEMVKSVLSLKDNYKAVAIPNDDYIFFLFYGGISPEYFLKNSDIIPFSSYKNWERVNRFENFYFKMPVNCPKSGKIGVLYVCLGGDVPQNSEIIKTIYYPDGVPAYILLEFYPLSRMPAKLPALPENVHYMVDVEKNPEFIDGIIPKDYPSLW